MYPLMYGQISMPTVVTHPPAGIKKAGIAGFVRETFQARNSMVCGLKIGAAIVATYG